MERPERSPAVSSGTLDPVLAGEHAAVARLHVADDGQAAAVPDAVQGAVEHRQLPLCWRAPRRCPPRRHASGAGAGILRDGDQVSDAGEQSVRGAKPPPLGALVPYVPPALTGVTPPPARGTVHEVEPRALATSGPAGCAWIAAERFEPSLLAEQLRLARTAAAEWFEPSFAAVQGGPDARGQSRVRRARAHGNGQRRSGGMNRTCRAKTRNIPQFNPRQCLLAPPTVWTPIAGLERHLHRRPSVRASRAGTPGTPLTARPFAPVLDCSARPRSTRRTAPGGPARTATPPTASA